MKSLDIYSSCIPSNYKWIPAVVDEMIHKLQLTDQPVSECALFELKVILNEVLINAVKHGNHEDEKKNVKIKASLTGKGQLSIMVEDEGQGFDFAGICKHRIPCTEETDLFDQGEGGRGIMIVRSLCDNVKVNRRGNRIVIIKSITER